MLALCLMLLVTYHALNYAGIIGLGLSCIVDKERSHGTDPTGNVSINLIISCTLGKNHVIKCVGVDPLYFCTSIAT